MNFRLRTWKDQEISESARCTNTTTPLFQLFLILVDLLAKAEFSAPSAEWSQKNKNIQHVFIEQRADLNALKSSCSNSFSRAHCGGSHSTHRWQNYLRRALRQFCFMSELPKGLIEVKLFFDVLFWSLIKKIQGCEFHNTPTNNCTCCSIFACFQQG